MLRGFKDVPRVVWLLAAGVFVNAVVGFTFVFVFVYLVGPRGLGAAQAGLAVGAGGVGLVAGNFTGGWYGDRFGHRRVLLTAAAFGGLTLACLPFLPTPLLCGLLPAVQYASGVIRAANSALVAVTVPEGARRQAYAVVRCASNGGFTLGPPLGALVAAGLSYDWLFVADGVGTLVLAVWTARIVPARGAGHGPVAARDGGPGRGVTAELRARPARLVLLAAVLVVDVVYRQQYSTLPIFLADHGFDIRAFGLVVALNGGVVLLLELPAAVVLRERPPLAVVGTGLLLVGAAHAVLTAGAGIASAAVMMVLLSLGEILYKTTATAYVADQAPAHAVGRFQSLYAGVSVSGVVLAAPLGGALYAAAPGLLWPACATLAAGAGVAVLWTAHRPPRRRDPVAGRARNPVVGHVREPMAGHVRGARPGRARSRDPERAEGAGGDRLAAGATGGEEAGADSRAPSATRGATVT
ncbi:MFS transporter [Streptomyces sp. NPDC055005]